MKNYRLLLLLGIVLLLLGSGIWFYLHAQNKSKTHSDWKQRFEKLETGMTRDAVYDILGFSAENTASGEVTYSPIPGKVMPAVDTTETYYFTDDSYVKIFTSKYSQKLKVLFNRNQSLEQKLQEGLD